MSRLIRIVLTPLLLFFFVHLQIGLAAETGPKPHKVGVLIFSQSFMPAYQGFKEGLERLGYTEGENIHFDVQVIDKEVSRVPELVSRFKEGRYDLILTTTTPVTRAVQSQNLRMSVIFTLVANPLRSELVASLKRPGGNISGISHIAFEILPRRLILFKTAFPDMRRVALFFNQKEAFLQGHVEQYLSGVAEELGVELVEIHIASGSELEALSQTLSRADFDGIFMRPDPGSVALLGQLNALARRERLPLMVVDNSLLAKAGVMGYSPGFHDVGVQAANMAHAVFQGADIGSLPVQNPDHIRLVVSMREVRRLGLTISEKILSQANEIIR